MLLSEHQKISVLNHDSGINTQQNDTVDFSDFQVFFSFGVCAAMKTTGCNLDKVNMLPNALITPLISSTMIKSEDITPMEVTAEKRSPSIFKVSYIDQ